MTADLPEFQQRIENDDVGARKALALHLGLDALVHGEADAFVKVALRAAEFDVLQNLGLGRQFLDDLLLAPAQDEWRDPVGQQLAAFVAPAFLDRAAEGRVEPDFVAEKTG